MTNFASPKFFFCSVSLFVGFAALLLPNYVQAVPPTSGNFKEPVGLVWFAGTVERVADGLPVIDLGEVHSLRKGSKVALIRYRDSHFSPQGVLEVRFSNPTWCQMENPKSFMAEVGDLVMFVETPRDLGSGEAIRDSFIRYRVVANANRNRYSTMNKSIEANELQRLSDRQPSWVEGNRSIAGIVRSSTVAPDMIARLKPFINQVMAFQEDEDLGVNIAQATSLAWKEVLDELRRKPASSETESLDDEQAAGAATTKNAVTTETHVGPDSSLVVRRQVDALMFQRSEEERSVAAVTCVTLLHTKTSNERQWMSQQLSRTQFPRLGREEQMLIDMETVMRRVRKTD